MEQFIDSENKVSMQKDYTLSDRQEGSKKADDMQSGCDQSGSILETVSEILNKKMSQIYIITIGNIGV